MQTVSFNTTQNVSIGYNLANVGERILANMLDYLFLGAYLLLAYLIAGKMGAIESLTTNVIIMLPVLLYQLICEIIMHGQSVGMRIRKIKVIRLDGKQAGIGNYLLRWLLRPVDIWMLSGAVGIVAISVSKNGQRIGDMAAGTTVVKINQQVSLEETIFENIDDNYQLRFPQAEKLNARDVEIMKDCIALYKKTGNLKPVIATGKKLKDVLGIQSDLKSYDFLRILIKDYNYLEGKA